jgi:hypothetical protein
MGIEALRCWIARLILSGSALLGGRREPLGSVWPLASSNQPSCTSSRQTYLGALVLNVYVIPVGFWFSCITETNCTFEVSIAPDAQSLMCITHSAVYLWSSADRC